MNQFPIWQETRTASGRQPLRIAWAPFAHPNAPSGYGVVANQLRQALGTAGAEILPTTSFGWDCVVAISLPAAWAVGATGRRPDLVYHTMYEMDRLPAAWPAVLNGCGLVWVPSVYCERLFRDAGVTAPLMVSGYGVDPQIYHPGGRQPGEKLRFGAWGVAFTGRKNLLLAARAFLAAHLPEDEAELVIKVNENFGTPIFRDEQDREIPNIHVTAGNWPASTVADWLRTLDVLIYPSGGEGFGLQPLEAMACGVLPICAYNTGMTDYLDVLPALQVPCPTQAPSPSYSKIWQEPLRQWQPDFDALVEHIRWCFAHQTEVTARGAECAGLVAENWTWAQAGTRALGQLEAYFGS